MMQHASGSTGERVQVPDFTCEIKRELSEDVGAVEMVPQEVGRAQLNLLSNAFDAVHSQNGTEGCVPTVRVRTLRMDGQVQIEVEDNGPGIPSEIREKIFEPFFTTKPTGSGTGLGLSLAYDIVTQGHGGTLAVQSENGEGATFIITLPAG